MNHYARLVLEHNQRHRPKGLTQIADPTAFFGAAGEQIQGDVTSLRDEILGARRGNEAGDHTRTVIAGEGFRRIAVDGVQELWVRDRVAVAQARLDRLQRSPGQERPHLRGVEPA